MSKQQAAIPVAQRESQEQRFDRIYKDIREAICLLDSPPGTMLSEGLLAEQFGVSRTPIRNVLLRLRYEGLVETRNGVGTIVTDLDLKSFRDIYELRMRLAEMTGALSPIEPSAEILDELKELGDSVRNLKDGPVDPRAYAQLCNELHELLLDLIGNQPLREITDRFYYQASRIWLTYLYNLDWVEAVEILQHEVSEILRALEIGDMHGVGNARRQYLYMTLTRISRYLVNV